MSTANVTLATKECVKEPVNRWTQEGIRYPVTTYIKSFVAYVVQGDIPVRGSVSFLIFFQVSLALLSAVVGQFPGVLNVIASETKDDVTSREEMLKKERRTLDPWYVPHCSISAYLQI